MSGRIRSPRLLAVALAMMASSGGLAYVLEHDAVGEETGTLSRALPGEEVTVKGTLQPFVEPAAPTSSREAQAWSKVHGLLDNVTYVVDTGAPGTVVLATSPRSGPPPGTVVVTSGPVLLRAPHPDGGGRTLLLLQAHGLEPPILFR